MVTKHLRDDDNDQCHEKGDQRDGVDVVTMLWVLMSVLPNNLMDSVHLIPSLYSADPTSTLYNIMYDSKKKFGSCFKI